MSDNRVRRNIEAVKTLLDQYIREAETDLETSAGHDGKLPWLDRQQQEFISAPQTQAMRLIMERMLRKNKYVSTRRLSVSERHVLTKHTACKPAGPLDEATMEAAFQELLEEGVIRRAGAYHGVDGYVPLQSPGSPALGVNLDEFIQFYRRIGGVGFSYQHSSAPSVVSIFVNPPLTGDLLPVLSYLAGHVAGELDFQPTATPGEIRGTYLRRGVTSPITAPLKMMRQALETDSLRQEVEKAWAIRTQDLSSIWDHQHSQHAASRIMARIKSVSAAFVADGFRSLIAPAGASKA